ncbi:MAG TPA: hypothetical protein VIQ23_15695 [Hanamia sp.]|jgi:hypothetical protein
MKKLLLSFIFVSAVFTGWSFSDKPGATPKDVNLVQVPSDNLFTFFNAHRQGFRSTGLMWRVSSSDNVVSFQVQRSYDGEFFATIKNEPCDTNTRFTWKDENVLPGYLYYRLAANLIDGTTVYSDVQLVHIVQK